MTSVCHTSIFVQQFISMTKGINFSFFDDFKLAQEEKHCLFNAIGGC